MSAGLPIKETVDASNAVFSSRTPFDAELSFDDKRRSSPTKRTNNGDHAQGLLQSEYRNATEMACSSTLHNGGVEDNDVDNTGDWKNTLGGNPKRFHPLWGPPIPRKGMTMTIGNGGKSEKIEWDPFFGPPVVKSRGVPKLTKAVEDGGDLTRVGLMANYHWEGLENGPISSPALQVPRPQHYQIGAPPPGGGGGMMMNPQQQLQHQQQQIQMMMQQLQQQQANGQPVTPQQQQQLMMMQQQHQMTINGGQHQQQQQPQFQQQGGQPMNPQQQQLMMQQMQMQQQQTGGQPFTPQQQQMLIQQRMQMQQQQQQGMQQQQQQPNNGNNLANQQQQQYPTYTQQQQQPAPTPVVEQQREPYSAPLSAQSSLGIELDTVAGGGGGGDGHSSAVSSSLDVDGVTARRVGTSPPAHNHKVDDDDL